MWPSEWRVPKAEVTWQQLSRTSLWSVWPSPWRLTQLGSHLELRYLHSLYSQLPTYLSLTHSSPYVLISLLRLCTSQNNILLRYLSEIIHLSGHAVCYPQLSQYAARKLSCWLDIIDNPPLCGSQPRISIGRNNWLDDKRSSSLYHQVN